MPVHLAEFWNNMVAGNSVKEYVIALAIFVAVIIVLRIFKFIIIKRLKKVFAKTKTDIDDTIINTIDKIGWPFYCVFSLYIAAKFIRIPDVLATGLWYLLLIVLTYYAIKAVQGIIDYAAHRWAKMRHAEEKDGGPIHLLARLLKGALWGIAIVLVLANMGYDVSALLAGLGIGGVAIAFALQNVLADIFASFSIYFDKPFKIGDFIIIGDDMGVVKKVGIKSTILESLWGEDIIVSNRELTTIRIHNYRTMKKRRIHFNIGVTYETSNEKLEKIPKLVKDVFSKVKLTELDRVHFKSFGDFSLNYEIAYYADTGDYNKYMDLQQQINLGIKKAFEKEGIEFAYPTQTILMQKS